MEPVRPAFVPDASPSRAEMEALQRDIAARESDASGTNAGRTGSIRSGRRDRPGRRGRDRRRTGAGWGRGGGP